MITLTCVSTFLIRMLLPKSSTSLALCEMPLVLVWNDWPNLAPNWSRCILAFPFCSCFHPTLSTLILLADCVRDPQDMPEPLSLCHRGRRPPTGPTPRCPPTEGRPTKTQRWQEMPPPRMLTAGDGATTCEETGLAKRRGYKGRVVVCWIEHWSCIDPISVYDLFGGSWTWIGNMGPALGFRDADRSTSTDCKRLRVGTCLFDALCKKCYAHQ